MVGAWDVLVHVEGPDLATIATQVLSEIHHVPGVVRTLTAPVVPPDRVGIAGWGAPQAPAIIGDACYVHIKAQAGAAAGIAERLGDMGDVSGVAVLGGEYDLLVCVAQPWEVASGVILEEIHAPAGRGLDRHPRLDPLRGARRGPRPVLGLDLTRSVGRPAQPALSGI